MRVAVIGHVEHVTLGRVPALPGPGEIAHLEHPRFLAGGGGGIAFFQLTRGAAEVHLFTALGDDEAGREVEAALAATGAHVYAARRASPHTRDLVLLPRGAAHPGAPAGDRAIVVVGEPLHPARADPLPWDLLAGCDAAYFTAQDPEVLRAARAAKLLVVTARRREALIRSGVEADIVVGSIGDPREASTLADYPKPPRALVLTDGARGGRIETREGVTHFAPTPAPATIVGSYGAGDSFAGALVYFLARGHSPLEAAGRAAPYGAAVLASLIPLDAQLAL